MNKVGELHGMPIYENQEVPSGLFYAVGKMCKHVKVDGKKIIITTRLIDVKEFYIDRNDGKESA